MFFRVQNLGPLRDAEVDLSKDLIVLAGPNNSGKTYVAWSVYGLYRNRPGLNVVLDRWAQRFVKPPDQAIDLAKLLEPGGSELLEDIAAAYMARLHLCFAAEISSDPACALPPDRLGVYLFNEQHAEPVPVGETGFSIKTINDVVNQLNADEQRLYARLEG